MKIMFNDHRGVTIASIVGNLDSNTSAEVSARLGEKINAGHIKLVLDMAGVSYLGSTGVRFIITSTQLARRVSGDLRLAGAKGNIKRVIDLSGMAKIIQIFPTTEEAIASYSA